MERSTFYVLSCSARVLVERCCEKWRLVYRRPCSLLCMWIAWAEHTLNGHRVSNAVIRVHLTLSVLSRALSVSGEGCCGRMLNEPEGPRIEVKGQEQGWGSWGGGSKPPLHQLEGPGSTVSFPSGVRSTAPTPKGFPLFSALRMAFYDTVILLIVDHKNCIS